LINFQDFLDTQNTEDRRTFIVHGPSMSGKTQFAQRLEAKRSDVFIFDLLSYFAENHKTPYDPDTLWDMLLKNEFSKPVIILDNADFLINTWSSDNKRNFLTKIQRQIRSPRDTKHTFGFFLQSDNMFRNVRFENSHGESRILLLNEIEAL